MTRDQLTTLDDQALVARINSVGARGPIAATAFTILYERHRDFVLRVAIRACNHESDALDASQDTFAYLFSKFPGFVLTSKLTTFLYPVATHQAMSKRRARCKAHSGHASDEHDPLDQQLSPTRPEAMNDARLRDLHTALAGLSTIHREVVLLRFVEDMSLEEIALAMHVPLGTVKSRLHFAINAMRSDPGVRRFFGYETDPTPASTPTPPTLGTSAQRLSAAEKADSA